jgi:UDP-N-acetylmuramoyl-L-alanyl-D-glutamate--2,6-diaminopimelate ligase
VVDFAHTPDGLLQALQALKPVALARQGKLKVIFGCGGNRDVSKRPLMGEIAQAHANEVVVSNDNPRDEAPADIAAQITAGATKATVILDRAQAIAQTILAAQAVDVILIAGKGHETTQIVAGEVHEFSDALHARAALNARKEGAV